MANDQANPIIREADRVFGDRSISRDDLREMLDEAESHIEILKESLACDEKNSEQGDD